MSHHNHEIDTPSGESHGTLSSYITGFILSVILTIIPYTFVVKHILTGNTLIIAVVLCAALQLIVQLIYFLHLDFSPKQQWNLISFTFTFLILVILVIGSLWIMYHLNVNMVQTPPDLQHQA